jgi:RimJ/RimL family protein N-acetyltransferase
MRERERVSVKLSKIEDAKLLLRIHNTSVKAGFFNSKNLINFNQHIKWFKKKLKSNSKIYIGNYKIKKFGYVRFDETKNNIFEISIGILPSYYGKGLGTLMLKKSIKKFKIKYKPKKIICAVKKFNIRSLKCFLKNGFIKVKFNKKKHSTINNLNIKQEYYLELKKTDNLKSLNRIS